VEVILSITQHIRTRILSSCVLTITLVCGSNLVGASTLKTQQFERCGISLRGDFKDIKIDYKEREIPLPNTGLNVVIKQYDLLYRGGAIQVFCGDYPPSVVRGRKNDEILRGGIDNTIKELRRGLTKTLRIISETDIDVGGVKGKEVIAEGKEGEIRSFAFSRDTWHVEMRIFIKGSRMMGVTFLGPRKPAQHPDTRQILDSIKFP